MNVIELDQVSKRYRLGEYKPGGSLREALASTARNVRRRPGQEEIWALRDVSMDVAEGEALGLIGRNGAGKSTVLKIISRITEPTSGVSRTRGRVAVLLEVGTGFHPELTGRENVYLNGAILGMGRRTIDRRFDEIVAFAAVEPFIDTPIKRYSTGMYLRLAFSVAAHLEPDILVVDEVLAVGDAEFQSKCLGRMESAEREGRTVVFVSHNLEAITRLCGRAIWLDGGSIQATGSSEQVVDQYLASLVQGRESGQGHIDPMSPVVVQHVEVTDRLGRPVEVIRSDQPFVVEVGFLVRTAIPSLDLGAIIARMGGSEVLNEAWSDDRSSRPNAPGAYVARLEVPPVLNVGEYVLGIWMGTKLDTFVHDTAARRFRIEGDVKGRPNRAVALKLPWQVQRSPAVPGTSSIASESS